MPSPHAVSGPSLVQRQVPARHSNGPELPAPPSQAPERSVRPQPPSARQNPVPHAVSGQGQPASPAGLIRQKPSAPQTKPASHPPSASQLKTMSSGTREHWHPATPTAASRLTAEAAVVSFKGGLT